MKSRLLMLICLVVFVGCKSTTDKPKESNITAIENFNFLLDLEGNPYNVDVLKGKKVLVNYWATWCAPCKNEMPELLAAQEKLTGENYIFLLVSDESLEKINAFKEATGFAFTFLKSDKSFPNLGVYALPTTFVFDENGVLSEKITGVVSWTSDEMINTLKNI